MSENKNIEEVVILGAGLTGLSLGYNLVKQGIRPIILEKTDRVGGQIKSHRIDDFIYESGPNTGIISNYEVVSLFNSLQKEANLKLELANRNAKNRLIWKKNRFEPLPSSLIGGIMTPLFRFKDKLRLLIEPFRSKGINPNETLSSLVRRRMGESFLEYAVDPFIGGIYAGDPDRLITRFALPKLYNLEHKYGSFIKGAIRMAKEPKPAHYKEITKDVFSVQGGLERLPIVLAESIGAESIKLNAHISKVLYRPDGIGSNWQIDFIQGDSKFSIYTKRLISVIPAYELANVFTNLNEPLFQDIIKLRYVPMVQVSVGYESLAMSKMGDFNAFGGLVPSCENMGVLGILFPSSCFASHAPKDGLMLSIFMGGSRYSSIIDLSDEDIRIRVVEAIEKMLKIDRKISPKYIKIFRHDKAIAQYEIDSENRIEAVRLLESKYLGLIIAGSLIGGIGMSDRIKQASDIANSFKY